MTRNVALDNPAERPEDDEFNRWPFSKRLALGRYAEAEKEFQVAIVQRPDYKWPSINLVKVYCAQQKYPEARKQFEGIRNTTSLWKSTWRRIAQSQPSPAAMISSATTGELPTETSVIGIWPARLGGARGVQNTAQSVGIASRQACHNSLASSGGNAPTSTTNFCHAAARSTGNGRRRGRLRGRCCRCCESLPIDRAGVANNLFEARMTAV
jgi:hypothetical protein